MKVPFLNALPFLLAGLSFTPALAAVFQGQGAAAETGVRLTPEILNAIFEDAWEKAGLKPAAPAEDAQWLRRASLVLNGVVPTSDEVVAFLADGSSQKRDKKVDELLSRPEFGEHFGGMWTLALVGRGGRRLRYERESFSDWVVDEFNKNTPFNKFTTEVIAATGRRDDNPAVGYIERWEAEPKDLAGQTAKAFLGVQIQCARCHDHKDQQWKQSEFNDFAAFFANTEIQRVGGTGNMQVNSIVDRPEPRNGRVAREIMKKQLEKRAKNIKNPEVAAKLMEKSELKFVEPTPLRPLEEGPLAVRPAEPPTSPASDDTVVERSRREELAAWMTTPGNPYYARSIVNTAFSQMFGYGLVTPHDDFRSDSIVAIPAMLDAIATDFERGGYNFKHLVGLLAKTKAFALSSAGTPNEKGNVREDHEKGFARYTMRPMSPEQLFDTITRVTGIDAAAEERAKRMKGVRNKKVQEMGEKAAEGYSRMRQGAIRKFINTFEDDESEDELAFEGTIPQALLLMNSRLITDSMRKGMTLQRVDGKSSDKLDFLYISALGRKPTAEERSKSSAFLAKAGAERRESWEDLLWVLINSAEFSAVH